MNKYVERLYNGIIKENPTFVLMLGMCPTLAVTSSAVNGIGMGLSTTVVLVMSNLLISMFRKVIPNGVRMPAYIVVVASLVTIVQFIMQAYTPALSASLGVYIPLIVVNCIILGRAESYASKNPIAPSIFDGLGMFFMHIGNLLTYYSFLFYIATFLCSFNKLCINKLIFFCIIQTIITNISSSKQWKTTVLRNNMFFICCQI